MGVYAILVSHIEDTSKYTAIKMHSVLQNNETSREVVYLYGYSQNLHTFMSFYKHQPACDSQWECMLFQFLTVAVQADILL
jgi:hypothetical protein